ncbi:hypothetical protein PM02_19305 [Sulfitobacter mediterraneus]|uniref:Uncharacterized protein n=1 Tax=Sulfitobacter mediterraneus TaxID=83219 RepID=A0A061SP69_9RHOB|nr:hypothetical protein PM02_19305 [Sulfitobacter mediterraneus]
MPCRVAVTTLSYIISMQIEVRKTAIARFGGGAVFFALEPGEVFSITPTSGIRKSPVTGSSASA